MPRFVPVVLTLMVMFFAACGSDDSTSGAPQGSGSGDHGMDMGGEQFAFGEPGDRSEADRTVDVSALDALEFDPDSLTVEAGETISFVVTNDGKNLHEFVLGDESYQQEHAAEMSEDEHMEIGPNQIQVEPGETETLTWTFTEAGEVLYGCHEPGHYEGGMVGAIEVGS
ncbi:MAG: plastocyanin/azurin family copper-binding protein [Actinomycetota bacterium]